MGLRNYWQRVKLGGAVVQAAAPVHTQNALEGAVTGVAEIELVTEGVTLAVGAALTVDHVQLDGNTGSGYPAHSQFGGSLDEIDAVSNPHAVTLRATGPLAGLRRVRTVDDGDLDLTGQTDQQAAAAILTFCGVPFTSGDINGLGYTLGARAPVLWTVGRNGADMLNELDTIMGCATVEIPEGRVVRFPYSHCPSLYPSPSYVGTYRRADSTAPLYGNERQRGRRDDIHNFWQVTGLSWEGAEGTADEGCTMTITAEGKAPNAALVVGGVQTYSGPDMIQSDLIQSEELAKAIVVRQLQWFNRLPDTARVDAPLDVQAQPGKLMLVKDPAYGVDLASDTPYVITDFDAEGDLMTLDGIGGAPGDTGTVTSSITRLCGAGLPTDIGLNPLPLTPAVPLLPPAVPLGLIDPADLGLALTVPAIGGFDIGALAGMPDLSGLEPGDCDIQPTDRGWACGTADLASAAAWTADMGAAPTAATGGGITLTADSQMHAAGVDLTWNPETQQPPSWELIGTVTLAGTDSLFWLGIGDAMEVGFGGPDVFFAAQGAFELGTESDTAHAAGTPFAPGQPIDFRVNWDQPSHTLSAVGCQGGVEKTGTLSIPYYVGQGPFSPTLKAANAAGSGAAATVSALTVNHDCAGELFGAALCGPFGQLGALAPTVTSGELIGTEGWRDSFYTEANNLKATDTRWTVWHWQADEIGVRAFNATAPYGTDGTAPIFLSQGFAHYPLSLPADKAWTLTAVFALDVPCELRLSVGHQADQGDLGEFFDYGDGTGDLMLLHWGQDTELSGLPSLAANDQRTLALAWDGVGTLTGSIDGTVVGTVTDPDFAANLAAEQTDYGWDQILLYPGIVITALPTVAACAPVGSVTSCTVEIAS